MQKKSIVDNVFTPWKDSKHGKRSLQIEDLLDEVLFIRIFMGYLKYVRQDAAGEEHYDSVVDKVCYALSEAEARFRDRMNTK